MAGGVNIFHDVSGDVQVDLETAVTRNPEVITVFTGHGDAGNESYNYVIASDSPFKTTDAYTNPNGKRIYLVDADLASRYGPRIVDALEIYARAIHPEIFGPPD
jgi:iron complex transport system substrate-binding protein